jgi:hypothetical protein
MALQPAIQGDRHTGQSITWYYADGVTVKDLTTAVITGTLTDPASDPTAPTTTPISGVLTLTNASGGVFSWAYGASDTATAGRFVAQFTATYGDGKPDSSFETDWEVKVRR